MEKLKTWKGQFYPLHDMNVPKSKSIRGKDSLDLLRMVASKRGSGYL